MQMTIYDAATVGSRSNCVYPNPVTVTDADMTAFRSCTCGQGWLSRKTAAGGPAYSAAACSAA